VYKRQVYRSSIVDVKMSPCPVIEAGLRISAFAGASTLTAEYG